MAGRKRKKLKARFYGIVFGLIAVISLAVFLANKLAHRNEIAYGSIGSELTAAAAIIRDEKVIATETYEKATFDVIEGQTVENGVQVAQVYKRGYQDETLVTMLNLKKQIYSHQMQLLGGVEPPELADVNGRIRTVEDQIRASSRGESELDMLQLEQSLKSLQEERAALLYAITPADAQLTAMYAELANQELTISGWKRSVVNNAGTGIVSFYFDGYEQALSINKLSTINAALVSSVVKGNNTSVSTESSGETPLYRLITPSHWFIAFVTDANDPLRLSAGEEYFITFPDYSDQVYQATARDSVISEKRVVNILEFYTDIGKLVGVRTVNAIITKSAQGLVVPTDAIEIVGGAAGINIEYGENPLRVEIDVLADDGKKAVIRAKNPTDTLAVGQKFIKP